MKNKIIILDTETTDASSEPGMIQLGYIVCDLQFNELKRENLFFSLEYDKTIDFGAMATHHITQEILLETLAEDSRSNDEKKKLAEEDLKDAYLVAHNSPFDKNVLDCNGIVTNEDQWIDTYNIAYDIYTDDDMKHSLQYLRYYLGCTFKEVIDAHDALSDVIVLKAVAEIIFGTYKETATAEGYDVDMEEHLEEFVKMTQRGIILRTWAFGKYKGQSFKEVYEKDMGYFSWMYNQKMQDGNTNDAVFNTIKYYLEKKD